MTMSVFKALYSPSGALGLRVDRQTVKGNGAAVFPLTHDRPRRI